MTDYTGPVEAQRALTEINSRQDQVARLAAVPTWLWWAMGGLTVLINAGMDTEDPFTIALASTVYAVGVGTVAVLVGRRVSRRAKVRSSIVAPVTLAFLGVTALAIGLSLPVTFALDEAGIPLPATLGGLFAAVIMCVAGPPAMRLARRRGRSRA